MNKAVELVDLVGDPDRMSGIQPEAIAPLLCQLSALQGALAARLSAIRRTDRACRWIL